MSTIFAYQNALAALLFWVVLQAIIMLYSAARGQILPSMLAAVDKAGPLEKGETREGTEHAFAFISVAWFVGITALAAYAFHAGYNGSTFWQVSFFIVGGWSLYDAASGPFVIGKMYPGKIAWQSWLQAGIGTIVWVFVFAALAARVLGYVI